MFACMPSDKRATKQQFAAFMERKNLRMTAPRQAIVDAALSTKQHFTAEQLIVWARKRDKSVSRATVYRTLPLLTESGLVREVDFGKDYRYYDPNYGRHPHHNHIICQDCNKIVEFDSAKIVELEEEIRSKFGFVPQSHRVQIMATCEQFRKFGACKHRGE